MTLEAVLVDWQRNMAMQGNPVGWIIPLSAGLLFVYFAIRRLAPLASARPAAWSDLPAVRLRHVIRLGLLQRRQAGYPLAGLAHAGIFYGFALSLPYLLVMLALGLPGFRPPSGAVWHVYAATCDFAALAVLCGCALAAGLRIARPDRYPRARRLSAFVILATVFSFTACHLLFRAALLALAGEPVVSPAWLLALLLGGMPEPHIAVVGRAAWVSHEILALGFLCSLPLTKQFHEFLGLANIWLMRVMPGSLTPCGHGLSEAETDDLPYLGVRDMDDLTFKQKLNLLSCADCGRCADNCPAAMAGRSLNPTEFIQAGRAALAGGRRKTPWSGEIWDCCFCGACEEACPLGIDHLDLMVDLRRYDVDEGNAPPGIGAAMDRLQVSGAPVAAEPGAAPWPAATTCEGYMGRQAGMVYLPSAFTTRDPMAREIAAGACLLLDRLDVGFSLLPGLDAGNEARRWGDEYLFRALRDQVLDGLKGMGARCVVTEDPHVLNALRKDAELNIPVRHLSEVLAEALPKALAEGRTGKHPGSCSGPGGLVHAVHDPCYLARHNGIWSAPRQVLHALGLQIRELRRHGRMTCCCGGPHAFFHEAGERGSPAGVRLAEAAACGVDVLVTACPWCAVNLGETARGLDSGIRVVDLTRLAVENLFPA